MFAYRLAIIDKCKEKNHPHIYTFSDFEEIGIKGFGPSDKSMIFIIPTMICAVVGIIFGMKKPIENLVMSTSTSSNFFDNNMEANENFQENFIEENDDDLYDNRQNEEDDDKTIPNIPIVNAQRPLIDI